MWLSAQQVYISLRNQPDLVQKIRKNLSNEASVFLSSPKIDVDTIIYQQFVDYLKQNELILEEVCNVLQPRYPSFSSIFQLSFSIDYQNIQLNVICRFAHHIYIALADFSDADVFHNNVSPKASLDDIKSLIAQLLCQAIEKLHSLAAQAQYGPDTKGYQSGATALAFDSHSGNVGLEFFQQLQPIATSAIAAYIGSKLGKKVKFRVGALEVEANSIKEAIKFYEQLRTLIGDIPENEPPNTERINEIQSKASEIESPDEQVRDIFSLRTKTKPTSKF